jgi:predicted outer membrane lipoprotein
VKWLKRNWWVVGLLLALAVAVLSPLASPHPDGLERVAKDQGFVDRAQDPPFHVISNYLFPGIHDERLASILAGLLGTAVVFALVYGVAWVARCKRSRSHDRPPTPSDPGPNVER